MATFLDLNMKVRKSVKKTIRPILRRFSLWRAKA